MCRPQHPEEKSLSAYPALKSQLPTINTKCTMMTDRKQAFLKRSLAHRTVCFIENEVGKVKAASSFLQSNNAALEQQRIAPLKRSEIQLGALVGQGGFSRVYQLEALSLSDCECEHDDDEQSVAQEQVREKLAATAPSGLVVKHLRKDLLTKRTRFQAAAADLVLESQFLARLDHPNIIKVRGWTASGISGLGDGQHDGYFLVMDKLDCTLAQKIQTWKEQEEQASLNKQHTTTSSDQHLKVKLRYASELASALEYLHQNRLVFRDLKPENIGILNDSIVLFDFGLCRELPESSCLDDTFEMSGVGTLHYMAPEIVQQQPYNQKSDVYSFAMVLYEMLFHSKPFELYSLCMHHFLVCEGQERPVIPNSCPPQLRALLEESWGTEPLDRPCLREIRSRLLVLQQESASCHTWKSYLELFWQSAATRHFSNTLQRSFSNSLFAVSTSQSSDRTNTTSAAESSSNGSWLAYSN